MKLLLRRMHLVNWHYFQEETVNFKDISLLAGDNGSGKSTIIDALQYALVADIRKICFNSSAASSRSSARSLDSYCRCKMGMEGAEYLRGDTISHVVLEFVAPERIFCAGVMVEAFTDGDVKETQWILDDHRLEDVPLSTDGFYLKIKDARNKLRRMGAVICATKRDYNSQLTMRLKVHRRNVRFNPYLEALLRSVSFSPLTSVDQFVCDYILEERMVDVSAMKENLDNYRNAEQEANLMKTKISVLEEIRDVQAEVDTVKRQIESQHFLRLKGGLLLVLREEEINQSALAEDVSELRLVQERLESFTERQSHYEIIRDELKVALAGNDIQRLLEDLERNRSDLERRKEEYRRQAERYDSVRKECEEVLGRGLYSDLDDEAKRVSAELEKSGEDLTRRNIDIKNTVEKLADLQAEFEELKAGNFRYPEEGLKLKTIFEEAGIETWIFADLLELIDEEWRNAVEGFLGTDRFSLLVDETKFDQAVEIYKDRSDEISGLALPRLSSMREIDIMAGSLAEVISSENPLARRYNAYLTGDVIRTDFENLKEFDRAITRDCMKYDDRSVTQIKPEIYSRWYIGRRAREERRRMVESEIEALKKTRNEALKLRKRLIERKEDLTRVFGLIHQVKDLNSAQNLERQYSEHLREIEKQIASVDSSEIKELRNRIAAAEEEIVKLKNDITESNIRLGGLRNDIASRKDKEKEIKVSRDESEAAFEEFIVDREHRLEDFLSYFNRRVKGGESASFQELKRVLANYENALKGLETRLEKSVNELQKRKSRFNRDFRIFLDEIAEGSKPYLDLLSRYRDTELPAYREKISRARREAERQFKEHFVARMNEYINDARESFSEINHTLKEISFGQDQYSFSIRERPEKRQVLEVFRTAMKVEEYRETLFEELSSDAERRSIEALFEEILRNDLDSPRVREICDYRTYFNYDIRIKHVNSIDENTGRPRESSLSKVLREKSGGESQTPYYVALGASFFRFFKDEEGAVRLAVFDEAFNKMDDNRIGTALTFFRRLGMQVITAVPTEKIETIAPYSDQINLIFRNNYKAYAREFLQEKPREKSPEAI